MIEKKLMEFNADTEESIIEETFIERLRPQSVAENAKERKWLRMKAVCSGLVAAITLVLGLSMIHKTLLPESGAPTLIVFLGLSVTSWLSFAFCLINTNELKMLSEPKDDDFQELNLAMKASDTVNDVILTMLKLQLGVITPRLISRLSRVATDEASGAYGRAIAKAQSAKMNNGDVES